MSGAWYVEPARRVCVPAWAPQDVGDIADALRTESYSLVRRRGWCVALAHDGEGAPDGGASRHGWRIKGAEEGGVNPPFRGRGLILASEAPAIEWCVLGEDGESWEVVE